MSQYIAKLTKPYTIMGPSGPLTTLNAGEFAGFSRREYDFIIDRRIGVPAKAVRMTVDVPRAEAQDKLGKSWESRKGCRKGQCYTLEATFADALIAKQFAVELVQAVTTAPHKDAAGRDREFGVFSCSKDELKKHQSDGTADAFVHPQDDLGDEDDDARLAAAKAPQSNASRR